MSKISPEAYAYYTDVERTGMVWEFSPMTLVTRAYQDGFDAANERILEKDMEIKNLMEYVGGNYYMSDFQSVDEMRNKIQKLEIALNKANQCIYCAIQSYPDLADRIGEQDRTKE